MLSPVLMYIHAKFGAVFGVPNSTLALDSQWSMRADPRAPAIFILVNGSYERPVVWVVDPYAAENVWRTSITSNGDVDDAIDVIQGRLAAASSAWTISDSAPSVPSHGAGPATGMNGGALGRWRRTEPGTPPVATKPPFAARPTPVQNGPSRGTRILCVDDAPDIPEMLERMLRHEPDLKYVGTIDTAEGLALEVAQRQADVVVLDLTMPGPDPLDAILEVSTLAPLCRVIAYSGYDDPATRDAARRAGAWDLISKNGEPRGIISAIRAVAGGDGGLRQGEKQ